MIDVENNSYQIDTGNPGAKVVIFAGIHGDEICGLVAIQELLAHDFSVTNGIVTFVLCNINGIKISERFTEFNMNRAFKDHTEYNEAEKDTYEWQRAQELKKHLNEADILLDIHSSFSVESEPFVICEKNADAITKHLPADFSKIVYGFDAIEPGGTDYYMNKVGKIGICVECGSHQNPNATELAKQAILSVLTSTGNVLGEVPKNSIDREYIQMDILYHTKSVDFTLTKAFADFEKVEKGSVIGIDGGKDVIAESDSIVLFARNRTIINDEAFLLGHKINI